MRYCPGNDRASGVEFPFRCHLSTAITAVADATAAAVATAVVADCFFQFRELEMLRWQSQAQLRSHLKYARRHDQ